MSTAIELKDFVQHVRDEVVSAYEARSSDPVFNLTEVELEVTFALASRGAGKGKLLVVDLEGEVSAERTHKVTLRLTPIPRLPASAPTTIRDLLNRSEFFPLGQFRRKNVEDLEP